MVQNFSTFGCPQCLIDFQTPDNLVDHAVTVHNLRECKCFFCAVLFDDRDEWKEHLFEGLRLEPLSQRPVSRPTSHFLPRDGFHMRRLVERIERENDAAVAATPMSSFHISRIGSEYHSEVTKPEEEQRTACGRYSYYPQKDVSMGSRYPSKGRKNSLGTGDVLGEGEAFPIPTPGQPWSVVDRAGRIVKSPRPIFTEYPKRRRFRKDFNARAVLTKRLKRKRIDDILIDPKTILAKRSQWDKHWIAKPKVETPPPRLPPAVIKTPANLPAHARFWSIVPKTTRSTAIERGYPSLTTNSRSWVPRKHTPTYSPVNLVTPVRAHTSVTNNQVVGNAHTAAPSTNRFNICSFDLFGHMDLELIYG